jgi:opacity protein-like surface antigen
VALDKGMERRMVPGRRPGYEVGVERHPHPCQQYDAAVEPKVERGKADCLLLASKPELNPMCPRLPISGGYRFMIRKLIAGAALSSALVVPSATNAQSVSLAEPNTITATPFLGISFGGSNDVDSSLGIGVAVGYDWTRMLGFEFEVGRVFDVAGDNANLDWSLTNISGNVVVHFAAPRLTPYATAGLGWERSSLDFDEPDPLALTVPSSTEIAFNFGGGVKVEINERLLARADLRRFQVNDLAPDHWRLYGGLTFWIKR